MGLHQLSSVTIGVPQVEQTAAFYEAFGLSPTGEGRFATRDRGEQLRLVQAPYRRVEEIAVGVDDADDIGRIRTALESAGHSTTQSGSTLSVREQHSGVSVVVAIQERASAPKVEVAPVNRPGVTERINHPAQVVLASTPVRPSKLSHLVMGTPNYDATMSFFTDLIGFQVSDAIPGIISFTRCSTDHHNLAIQATPAAFLHHVAFEVDSVDEVLRGGSNMIESGAERHMWGLGRHAIGSNWFWYLRDPAGNFVEYTADLDSITAQDLYVPKDWAGKEFLYAYGPPMPAEFIAPSDAEDIFAAQAGAR
jgi:catechol 2,3-dioxygenase-like lactoylglutathione lyase family enzyme